ncbi:MAG TPA: nickel-dependent lactate racemase [Candidatus Bathyarchaeia archaeon]|nr:nickel-dependent lactate racemase [Candidatus Bathyarchaeia archaeon]
MVDVWLPYGKTDVCVRIPARNFLGSIMPKQLPAAPDAKAEIERALNEPIGSKKLAEVAKPESKVAIVVDDATRHAPSDVMLLPVLAELNVAGVKDENVTVIFGCGTHRAVTDEEARRLLGDEACRRVKAVSHDCRANDLVHVGNTRTHGNKVYLNRVFAESDVKILLGDVGFHYYAGYGGGRKSVLPAVAGEETIKHNHAMLLNPDARTGILRGNPVHEDMTEAARLAKVDFIMNTVSNSKCEIVKAFAGDVEQAFLEAVKAVDEMYRVAVDRRADVVVASPGGYPADMNLFQAYKALDNALAIVKRGGVVVLVAECAEGHGNPVFYDWMARLGELKTVEREIKRNFVLGGHKAYYLLKALQNHQIILVSSLPDYYANIFKLKTARAVNDALTEAFKIAGSGARVWAMPYGNYMLPEVKVAEEQVQKE